MAAAGDLTTLKRVKDYLGLRGAEYDDVIGKMITSYSAALEGYINRTIKATDYSELRNGNGSVKLILVNYPVNSVASITINSATVPPSAYVATKTAIVLTNGSFTKGTFNVQVAYNAGYSPVPDDVEQALVEWIELRFKRKGSSDLVSKGLAGETTTYSMDPMPSSAKLVLQPYKRLFMPQP